MSVFQSFLFAVVSFLASVVGAICGIGGGVIIKPTLDLFGWASVSTISFLSGCTVLAMSSYSVGKGLLAHDSPIDLSTGTPLAVGGAVGGIVGKQLFSYVKAMFVNQNTVGGVQAVCLALITLLTLLYTVRKDSFHTKHVRSAPVCLVIGLFLGVMSSFLGIGGGPINLIVLYYFFSMDTKTAAANSLYIIFFSQLTSLLATLFTHTVPVFAPSALILMVAGGIGGGMLGRRINKKIENAVVERLFMTLMIVIIGISAYNIWRYFSL